MGPLVITPNHQTYADPVLVTIPVHRPIYYMAWSRLFTVPGLGSFIRLLRAFPVQIEGADPRAARAAARLLRAAEAVMIFPEGGRSVDGTVGRFKSGAFRLAGAHRSRACWVAVGCRTASSRASISIPLTAPHRRLLEPEPPGRRSARPLLHTVARAHQPRQQAVDLLPARGLERQLHLGVADRRGRERSMVVDLEDVGAILRDQRGQARQRSRPIVEHDTHADETAVLHEATVDDAREHRDVDVAAGEHEHDPSAGQAERPIDERSQGSRTGALDDRLLDLA